MQLRDYQQRAYDAVIEWIRHCVDACLVEAATGAGKSYIIAAVAEKIHEISDGKHVLCLAPSAELVQQNREKYLLTGKPASIFSASAGGRCLKHPVVFGTPGTVKNQIHKFGDRFAAVVVDEAHRITPTIKAIIESIAEQNPNVRVIGLTATPYRLMEGYIYRLDENGKEVDQAQDPYFFRLASKVSAYELIERGFLTRPAIGYINSETYKTKHMQINSRGQFDSEDVDRAFVGQGRKTSNIIHEVVELSRGRMGVMIFAATRAHARECMESLPPDLSEIVTGETPAKERKRILKDFKQQKIKYLVNVSVLTTGFDAEHVDVIALLRATESVSLLQQIIGRGLRKHEHKNDCLVLDYAENIERHCPDGDIFNPKIEAKKKKTGGGEISAICELCGFENWFPARPNPEEYAINAAGYFCDLDGSQLEIPAHYGRRCTNWLQGADFRYHQCSYRWSAKECEECGHLNDIAARYCESCKAEIVDPNEKLREEFIKQKKNPREVSTDNVLDWQLEDTLSQAGNPVLKVHYQTDWRKNITVYYAYTSNAKKAQRKVAHFRHETNNGKTMPTTITYRKDDNGFWDILDYNRPADEVPRLD